MNSEFELLGATRSFSNRTKDIFSSLNSIETSHTNFLKDPANQKKSTDYIKEDPIEEYHDDVIKKPHLNKDLISTFKQPRPYRRPIKGNNQITKSKHASPKWTHYSLADVPLVTDRSNRLAVEDLLKLKASKAGPTHEDAGIDTNTGKHIFKKPVKTILSSEKDSFDHKRLALNYDYDDVDDADFAASDADRICLAEDPTSSICVNTKIEMFKKGPAKKSAKKSLRCNIDEECEENMNSNDLQLNQPSELELNNRIDDIRNEENDYFSDNSSSMD